MDSLSAAGAAGAAGYLVGSIPFAWIAVRWRTGRDLRREGSGNVGATNASRILGRPWFLALFILDASKGAVAVLLGGALPTEGWLPVLPALAGAVGAILGHLLPVWLGFRGGKAVATGAGALAILSPVAAAAGLLAFAATATIFRYVSLGSIVGAAAAAAAEWRMFTGTDYGDVWNRYAILAFVALLALVVILKHVPNLRRIAAGTEPRIGGDPADAKEDSGEA
jgi:glycerol-3-phosphate acyltransferase PlsY